jgi:DNA polymerase lambda
MPRDEAKAIFESIKPIGNSCFHPCGTSGSHRTALRLDPDLFIEIMGSYRRYVQHVPASGIRRAPLTHAHRGKDTCGDIDILITRPTDDGRTHEGTHVFPRALLSC